MSGTVNRPVGRRATGTVEHHPWKDGRTVTWRLRVPHRGKRYRVELGTNHQGWNEARAQLELERIMGQIERGTWSPPKPKVDTVAVPVETLHVTMSRWWERKQRELKPSTVVDYTSRMADILDHLERVETGRIDIRCVDGLRDKLLDKGMSGRSVNMRLGLLAAVLDEAVDYGLLATNPARGKRRRVKERRNPHRTFIEADMVVDLLEEAGSWEVSLAPHMRYGRRALLATLCLAGLRIDEALSVKLGALDVHGGRLTVVDSKTEAGVRQVELTAYLADELRSHLAGIDPALRSRKRLPLFHSRTGGKLNPSNVRRMLNGAPPNEAEKRARMVGLVERVNEKRADEGRALLPERLTPHAFRRTFASLAFAAGRDPRFVMAQIGHTDARFTLSVYAQHMQRQHVDGALILELMQFPVEADRGSDPAGFSPPNRPTSRIDAAADVDGAPGDR